MFDLPDFVELIKNFTIRDGGSGNPLVILPCNIAWSTSLGSGTEVEVLELDILFYVTQVVDQIKYFSNPSVQFNLNFHESEKSI